MFVALNVMLLNVSSVKYTTNVCVLQLKCVTTVKSRKQRFLSQCLFY